MFDRFAIFHKGGAVLWNKEASLPLPSSPHCLQGKGAASVLSGDVGWEDA